MPACLSKSVGTYAALGADYGSTPSTCTTDRALSSIKLKIRISSAEVLETILYGCVTWSPRACNYDTLRRAHHSFLTRCNGWRNKNHIDNPISNLDTLIKTRKKSIKEEAGLVRVICGAHGGDEAAKVHNIR